MRGWFRAWVWLGLGSIVLLCGMTGERLRAQGVTTTNEVRAMRGLGPIPVPGSEIRDQGSGVSVELPTVEELEG